MAETPKPAPAIQTIDPAAVSQVAAALKELKVGFSGAALGGDENLQVYRAARNSESGAGLVTYTDAKTGEIMVLLEQPLRNFDKEGKPKSVDAWEHIAGYREVGDEAPLVKAADTPSNMIAPTQKNLKEAFGEKLAELQKADTSAEAIEAYFADSKNIRKLLEAKNIDWKQLKDINLSDAFVREVGEETGVDISAAKILAVQVTGTTNFGSAGGRNNHTDHMFATDLGVLEEAPKLTPQEKEVKEVKWVSLKDIKVDENHAYVIPGAEKGSDQLKAHAAPLMELALEKLLDEKIRKATETTLPDGTTVSEFDSARDVHARVLIMAAKQKPGMSGELGTLLSSTDKEDGGFKSFVGEAGQERMKLLLAAAEGLSQGKSIEEIFPPNDKKAVAEAYTVPKGELPPAQTDLPAGPVQVAGAVKL